MLHFSGLSMKVKDLDNLCNSIHSECINISKYISLIKDEYAKKVNFNISISKTVLIPTFSNLD